MRTKVQAYTWGICLGSAYADNKIFKMSALRKKELLQTEIIGIKNKMIVVIWAAAFLIGLFMILNKKSEYMEVKNDDK